MAMMIWLVDVVDALQERIAGILACLHIHSLRMDQNRDTLLMLESRIADADARIARLERQRTADAGAIQPGDIHVAPAPDVGAADIARRIIDGFRGCQ